MHRWSKLQGALLSFHTKLLVANTGGCTFLAEPRARLHAVKLMKLSVANTWLMEPWTARCNSELLVASTGGYT